MAYKNEVYNMPCNECQLWYNRHAKHSLFKRVSKHKNYITKLPLCKSAGKRHSGRKFIRRRRHILKPILASSILVYVCMIHYVVHITKLPVSWCTSPFTLQRYCYGNNTRCCAICYPYSFRIS